MEGCINLKRRFGGRYRVTHEESYWAERPEFRKAEEVWLQIIPCRYGHLYPFGGRRLAASVDGFPKVAGRMKRLKCCRIHQDGDFGELTVIFDVADFGQVAKIMRPRRRRWVSETERQRLRGIGFQKGHQTHTDVQHTARACVSEGRDGSETPSRANAPV